jgi:predicted RNase H-like HicB family nuclease
MDDEKEIVKVEGFNVKVWQEEGTFIAEVQELPGCVNEGKSKEEVLVKIQKTIFAYLASIAGDLPKNSPQGVLGKPDKKGPQKKRTIN